jgi:hypothetical protein
MASTTTTTAAIAAAPIRVVPRVAEVEAPIPGEREDPECEAERDEEQQDCSYDHCEHLVTGVGARGSPMPWRRG